MYNFSSGKKINELITATSNLSKGLENLSHIREKGLKSWDEKYKISESYDNTRKFISLTEISRMSKGVERIYKLIVIPNLSKGLENLSHIKEKGFESWNEKYKISENYNNARKFLSFTEGLEINKMSRRIETVYKILFGDAWKEKLNEKTN